MIMNKCAHSAFISFKTLIFCRKKYKISRFRCRQHLIALKRIHQLIFQKVQRSEGRFTLFFKFLSQKSQKFRTLMAYLPAFEFELFLRV